MTLSPANQEPVETLQYAHSADTLGLAVLAPALRTMVLLAVFSGLCVGSCFLVLVNKSNAAAVVVHLLTFSITVVLAMIAGKRLLPVFGDQQTWIVPDLLALAGLGIVGVAPLAPNTLMQQSSLGTAALALAYFLLFVTSYRHVRFYGRLAELFRQGPHAKLDRWLVGVGWIKGVYETVWLGCCFATLALLVLRSDAAVFFAYGALFGAMGFGLVWLLMILTHVMAWSAAKAASVPPGVFPRPVFNGQ